MSRRCRAEDLLPGDVLVYPLRRWYQRRLLIEITCTYQDPDNPWTLDVEYQEAHPAPWRRAPRTGIFPICYGDRVRLVGFGGEG